MNLDTIEAKKLFKTSSQKLDKKTAKNTNQAGNQLKIIY